MIQYICDKCGKVINWDKEKMITVSITDQEPNCFISDYDDELQICEHCAKKLQSWLHHKNWEEYEAEVKQYEKAGDFGKIVWKKSEDRMMKVSELIEALQKVDPNSDIELVDDNYYDYSEDFFEIHRISVSGNDVSLYIRET